MQSQDYAGAKWAVGQRLKEGGDDVVERAFDDGLILRTHVLRPTWHFVAPDDIRWMLALTAPRLRRAMAYYDRQLKLTESVFRRGNQAITRALAGGRFQTRTELGEVLARAGIQASGQRLGHLVMRAELDAVICSGPRRGKQFTYALLDERAPPATTLARDEALGALAARYFASHGPALPLDFSWWSGLTLADARRGVQIAGRQLAAVPIAGQTYWHAASGSGSAGRAAKAERSAVHLLPNFDEYVIAYKERGAAMDPAVFSARPGARNEIVGSHLILVGGRVVGRWRRLLDKKSVIVETHLLAKLAAAEYQGLHAAAQRLAAFLNQPVALREAARGRKPPGRAAAASRRSS